MLESFPALWNGLRIAGTLMMVWLAVEAWRGAGKETPAANGTTGRAFATGALINLLNPQAYLFFVVVAPQFLAGETLSIGNALLLSLISTAIATLIHCAIVLAGARAQGWLSDPRRTRTVRRIFALIILGVAASFLLTPVR